jgi:hypothetical protein
MTWYYCPRVMLEEIKKIADFQRVNLLLNVALFLADQIMVIIFKIANKIVTLNRGDQDLSHKIIPGYNFNEF